MNALRIVLCILLLLIAAAPLLAQGTYTQIDYPGAMDTAPLGIDSAGEVVGRYCDSVGTHGFLLSGGTYSTIDDPTGGETILHGINDDGQIVGSGGNPYGSFIYDVATQSFTSVSYPNSISTTATAINNAGTVAGYFFDSALNVVKSFELVGSIYAGVNRPGTLNLYVTGVSSAGTLVGYAQSRRTMLYVNYSDIQGVYKKQWIVRGAFVNGINPIGDSLVGTYSAGGGVVAGFLFHNQTLTTLEFPGSNNTDATGINSTGTVVGYFLDSSGNEHGFLWTPSADAPKP